MTAWFTFDEPLFAKATHVPGIVGNALRFAGKESYFEIPAATPGLNAGEENFTAEVWIRTTTKQVMRNIIDKRDAAPRGWLILYPPGLRRLPGRLRRRTHRYHRHGLSHR